MDHVLDRLAQEIHQRGPREHGKLLTLPQVREILKKTDKTLFEPLRDGKTTLTQVKARLLEKLQNVKYACLDDMNEIVHEQLQMKDKDYTETERRMNIVNAKGPDGKISVEEITRHHSPWESNRRCLKSIFQLVDKPKPEKKFLYSSHANASLPTSPDKQQQYARPQRQLKDSKPHPP